jgi:hypothetical protein
MFHRSQKCHSLLNFALLRMSGCKRVSGMLTLLASHNHTLARRKGFYQLRRKAPASAMGMKAAPRSGSLFHFCMRYKEWFNSSFARTQLNIVRVPWRRATGKNDTVLPIVPYNARVVFEQCSLAGMKRTIGMGRHTSVNPEAPGAGAMGSRHIVVQPAIARFPLNSLTAAKDFGLPPLTEPYSRKVGGVVPLPKLLTCKAKSAPSCRETFAQGYCEYRFNSHK